jgi:hypothetical protein
MNSGWEISSPDRRLSLKWLLADRSLATGRSFYRLTKFRAEISVDRAISSNQITEVQDVCYIARTECSTD